MAAVRSRRCWPARWCARSFDLLPAAVRGRSAASCCCWRGAPALGRRDPRRSARWSSCGRRCWSSWAWRGCSGTGGGAPPGAWAPEPPRRRPPGCCRSSCSAAFPGRRSLVRFHARPAGADRVAAPATVLFVARRTRTSPAIRSGPTRSSPTAWTAVRPDAVRAAWRARCSSLTLAVVAVLALPASPRDADGLLLAALGGVRRRSSSLGKVLSPQYLLWLLPLAALAAARGARAARPRWSRVAAVLTQLWFPGSLLRPRLRGRRGSSALVGVRNLLLLLALAATVRALARSPRPAAAAPRTG